MIACIQGGIDQIFLLETSTCMIMDGACIIIFKGDNT